ncbi:MAG: methanol/ethanol family PQQ-dependent dehydrogenase [Pyrinomonadaceae bacterium]
MKRTRKELHISIWVLAGIVSLISAFAACSTRKAESQPPSPGSFPNRVQTSPTGAQQAVAETEDGQWIMPAKNYASTRFSGLQDINTGNAKDLKLAWSFSTGVLRGHEAAPIVVNNTMYIVTPYPNIVYALDLTQPGAPIKWKYEPNPSAAAQGVACCDFVNRGCVFANGRIYFNTLDDQTIALDAATGKEVWKTKVGDINQGESITMAPLVVKNKVLVGNSGGEFGVRGWLTALDTDSGKIAWRAYHTGPDADVLIGPNFKPFYPQDQGKDLGVASWPADAWKIGGGTMWGWISYDPDQNLIFYGTANPGPWNPDQRPGDNKWTCGVFARDPDTGDAHWFYQFTPHDLHDYDSINEQILLDLPVNGQMRRVLVRPERNGYVYVIDRTNGQVLSANPFAYITSSKGVDLASGKFIENEEKKPEVGKVIREICPASPGAKDWQPSAFSPNTGLIYIPHQNLCMDAEGLEANYIAGTPYVGMNVRMYAGPGGNRGEFLAWDPVSGQKVWAIQEKFPVWSGALATGGDLVFYGTMDGWFKAVDAHSGNLLWQFKCGSGIVGQPISYRGPDGKQYVAILSGVGGWSGAIVAGGLDPRDATGALGFTGAMTDLPDATTKGGTLYVFSLP